MGFISTLFLVIVSVGAAQATDPATTDLVKKMGDYVAGYGEQDLRDHWQSRSTRSW